MKKISSLILLIFGILLTGCNDVNQLISDENNKIEYNQEARQATNSDIIKAQKIVIDYVYNSDNFGSNFHINTTEPIECDNEGCFLINYSYMENSPEFSEMQELVRGSIELDNWELAKIEEENTGILQSAAEGGVSSIVSTENCDLSEYDLDCNTVKGLEENLAWANEPNGVDFCSYEILDVRGDYYYLQVLCEEYSPQNEKIICPDEETKEACFMSKSIDKQECRDFCEFQEVEPYLVNGSGISIPVKINIAENGFTLWTPRDGSYYDKDLRENLTQKAYNKLDEVNSLNLRADNIYRAENYFGIKASFEIVEKTGQTCEANFDCYLPEEYSIRSNFPCEVRCVENQCEVGYYDFFDHTDFPELGDGEWLYYDEKYETLSGIKYPQDFYIDDSSGIEIRNSKLPLSQGGSNTCVFEEPCGTEGLQISIGYTKAPNADFLVDTDYENIKKIKENPLGDDMEFDFNYDEYYFLGEDSVYVIQVHERNFNGDKEKILNEILSSLHE